GDERLSAKKRSKAAGKKVRTRRDSVAPSTPPTARKSRSSDLGRALRTVYDDTLRESVPDDFMDLLRKLS
ncbi:MAG: NepR family anti-sigma factor, partial [Sphingomicrobium sp.]